jgi:hypothetical protein
MKKKKFRLGSVETQYGTYKIRKIPENETGERERNVISTYLHI